MKKRETKALDPSEMGLYNKVCCNVKVVGDNPKELGKNIALFAEEYYLFIYKL